tara:strand:+ start:50484 stop:51137 length:654 start_codon:yes stop_codon:yes gene_type:complete
MLLYLIALILSITKYHLYYDSLLKYLPILIGYTFLTETFGIIIRDVDEIQIIYKQGYYNYNTVIFNIFDIIFFTYFFYVYYHIIDNLNSKKIIKYGTWVFLVICVFNLFIQDFYVYPQNYAIIIGSLILLFAVLTYLNKVFQEQQGLLLHTNLLFWISIGILFFYTCYPVTMYILSNYYDVYSEYNLSVFHYATIGVFYSCISIGFILMKRLRISAD